MEGKRITELSSTSTAAGEGLRFSCHFEENSISFCDLEGLKVKIEGLGLASFCPGPQGNIRGIFNMLRDFPRPLYSINLFPLWMWREIHHIPIRSHFTGALDSRIFHKPMAALLAGMLLLGLCARHRSAPPLRLSLSNTS